MNHRLTRRQFGQLVIAGTAGVGFATLTSRTFAQTPVPTPKLVIIGVGPSTTSSSTADTPANDANFTETDTDDTATINTAPSTRKLELQYLNLGTSQPVQTVTTASILEAGDQITGFTVLADNTLIVAITPASTSQKGDNPTRLISLGTSPKTVNVSGLKKKEALASLLLLNDGSLIGLVVQKDGTPPVKLVDINPQTGEIVDKNRIGLPKDQRYSNLAQCPDGKLYTTSVARDGTTSLVEMELAQKKPVAVTQLRLNDMVWNNGLQSLVCSPAGQLFALGALWHETRQYLYTVDTKTGNMTRLQAFDVTKITLARTEG